MRRERAELHKKRHDIYPPSDALFLAANGDIVTYRMLSYNFASVVERANAMGMDYKGQSFTAKMLRHLFATYFVYDALKKANRLGKPYIYDAALDDQLRRWMGHESVETTYRYYVHLVNRFVGGELLLDIANSHIEGLSAALHDALYGEEQAQ
jgi:integrase